MQQLLRSGAFSRSTTSKFSPIMASALQENMLFSSFGVKRGLLTSASFQGQPTFPDHLAYKFSAKQFSSECGDDVEDTNTSIGTSVLLSWAGGSTEITTNARGTLRDLEMAVFAAMPEADSLVLRDADGVRLSGGTRLYELFPCDSALTSPFDMSVITKDGTVLTATASASEEFGPHDSKNENVYRGALLGAVEVGSIARRRADEETKLLRVSALIDAVQTRMNSMEGSAHRSMTLRKVAMGTFLVTQFGVLSHLVWYQYSWDVMEPACYFLGLVSVVLTSGYFAVKHKDPTYGYVHETAVTGKLRSNAEYRRAEEELRCLREKAQLSASQLATLRARLGE